MKLRNISYKENCYVYSTSYRFCFPFTFVPSTTVAPVNRDLSRAVSFMWNRKDRDLLLFLHQEVERAVEKWGLDEIYRLAVTTFAYPDGAPRMGLEKLAEGFRVNGEEFYFSEALLSGLRSFAPSKWPCPDQLKKARAIWVATDK